MGYYFYGDLSKIKNFVALWTFKNGSQCEIPKMCNILKMADRAKRMKN